MKNRVKKYIVGQYIDLIKENDYNHSLEKTAFCLFDRNVNVENEAIASVTEEEKIYEYLLSVLEDGGTLEECLHLAEKFDTPSNPISKVLKEKIYTKQKVSNFH